MMILLFHNISTIVSNRKGVPSGLKSKKKQPKGTVEAFRFDNGRENILALSWYDKRKVLMITTK